MTITIEDLFALHGLAAYEKQQRLLTVIEDGEGLLNMDAGIITAGQRVFPAQVLGSVTLDGGWLWAWADHNRHIPEAMLQAVNTIWEFGERYAVDVLEQPQLATPPFNGDYLALIAVGICRASGYTCRRYDDGSALYCLTTARAVDKLPGWDAARLVDGFHDLDRVHTFPHRTALLAYLAQHGVEVQTDKEGLTLHFTLRGADLRAEFGAEHGRVTALDVVG